MEKPRFGIAASVVTTLVTLVMLITGFVVLAFFHGQYNHRWRTFGEWLGDCLTPSVTIYGKVVDEKGNAIPKAEIDYTFLTLSEAFNPYSVPRGASFQALDDGTFVIQDIECARFSVNVSKEGYHRNEVTFSGVGGTQVITLRSKASRERVIDHRDDPTFEFKFNDQLQQYKQLVFPMSVSPSGLASCKLLADLNVVWESGPPHRIAHSWNCRFSMTGGGFADMPSPYAEIAPADGFKDTITYESVQISVYSDEKDKTYFIKTPDGHFARAEIRFQIDQEGRAFCQVRYIINPKTGSRFLSDPE